MRERARDKTKHNVRQHCVAFCVTCVIELSAITIIIINTAKLRNCKLNEKGKMKPAISAENLCGTVCIISIIIAII